MKSHLSSTEAEEILELTQSDLDAIADWLKRARDNGDQQAVDAYLAARQRVYAIRKSVVTTHTVFPRRYRSITSLEWFGTFTQAASQLRKDVRALGNGMLPGAFADQLSALSAAHRENLLAERLRYREASPAYGGETGDQSPGDAAGEALNV